MRRDARPGYRRASRTLTPRYTDTGLRGDESWTVTGQRERVSPESYSSRVACLVSRW